MKRIEVIEGPFAIERPWQPAPGAVRHVMSDALAGSRPRLETSVTIWRDQARLFILFTGADDEVVATLREHDSDLFTEDVVEVFLAPKRLEEYFEIEVNPLGAVFDARVSSPALSREAMTVDRSWDCQGLFAAVRRQSEGDGITTVDTILCIPFEALGSETPARGEVWRGNFYRIDRGSRGDSFSAWSPTFADPPDFHLPGKFGELVFS